MNNKGKVWQGKLGKIFNYLVLKEAVSSYFIISREIYQKTLHGYINWKSAFEK